MSSYIVVPKDSMNKSQLEMLERERETMKKILEITSVASTCLYNYYNDDIAY